MNNRMQLGIWNGSPERKARWKGVACRHHMAAQRD
jgi:hypothetical protein